MTVPENVRINTIVPFPSLVIANGPVTIAKQNGIWTVGFNISNLSAVANGTPPGNMELLVYNTLLNSFQQTPASALLAGGPLTNSPPSTKTANYAQAAGDSSLIFNGAGSLTLTLLSAGSVPGQWLYVKTIAAQTVVSASSNVVPLAGGAAGTTILAATAGKWALLQSDGTNWIIMASN